MSTRISYKFKLEKIVDHTYQVRELFLKLIPPSDTNQSFQFKAGQFVSLHVPNPTDPNGKPVLRAYSIASQEQRTDGFQLLFKHVENGIASTYVWGLKGEEVLTFTGPFGRVFFAEPPTEQIVYLNTGTGLSQHFSYMDSKKHLYPNLKYRMLFGLRNERDIYYQKELDALAKNFKDFQYEYVLSRPNDSWTGKKGYVQNFISDFDYKNIPTTFYLCGNGGMIKETKLQLLERDGFDKNRIFSEAFD
jgi:CDP-4-dehydro-6-deoxyglucose reductase, E3